MMKRIKRFFRKYLPSSISGKVSVVLLLAWVFVAILSPFIANNKPIIAKNSEGWSMPVWSKSDVIETHNYTFSIDPLIPYRFNDLDLGNSLQPPLSDGKNGIHLLGTDKLGRDIAAGMINGARVAFVVVFFVISFSAVFGIFVGMMIGYYGDSGIRKNIFQQLLIALLFIYLIYFSSHLLSDGLSISTLLPILILFGIGYFGNRLLARLSIKRYGLPIDIIVQRLFEINESLPGLFIILAFIAIITNSTLLSISLIMTFLLWMTFARHARAEALQIKEEAYIASARASGMTDMMLMVRHILPNALPSLLVVTAFACSGVILLESTLSFLGIGLPLEEISWGKILSEARKTPKAWWLAVFPGMAIFVILYSFNTLGDIMATYQRNQN
ncbi:MAG: ABC transporter permease [Bacteroidota bacterium]